MPLNENKRIRICPREFTDRTGTDTAKVTDWENWEKELTLSSSSPTPPPQHHSASCFQSKMGLFSWLTSTILPKLLNNSIFGRSYYTSRLCKQNTDIPWGTVVAFPYTNSAFNWHFVLNLQIETGNQFSYSAAGLWMQIAETDINLSSF